MGSLCPASLPHSEAAASSAPIPSESACSPPPPPATVLGQGDSDLPGEIPGTTANQSPLLGVCECSPGSTGDGGRQGGLRAIAAGEALETILKTHVFQVYRVNSPRSFSDPTEHMPGHHLAVGGAGRGRSQHGGSEVLEQSFARKWRRGREEGLPPNWASGLPLYPPCSQRCSLPRGLSGVPRSYSEPQLMVRSWHVGPSEPTVHCLGVPHTSDPIPATPPSQLAGSPQNCWLSGPTVPSHPQKHSGEGHPRSLRRRWQLRRKGGWKL